MKRILTILILMTILMTILMLGVKAEELNAASKGEELGTYIEDKIVPVIVGVVTSIIALLGTLKGLLSTLKELKGARNDFNATSAQIKETHENESRALRADYEKIKESIKDVPLVLCSMEEQGDKIRELESVMLVMVQVLSLAYSANSELVRTGKAKEMTRLLSKMKQTVGAEADKEGVGECDET